MFYPEVQRRKMVEGDISTERIFIQINGSGNVTSLSEKICWLEKSILDSSLADNTERRSIETNS